MKVSFKVLPPTMPNFVQFESDPVKREEGFTPKEGYPIAKFTREEAEQYAELMKQAFIKHWESKQNNQTR